MGVRYAATVLRGKDERAPNAKPAPRAAAEETARGEAQGAGGRAAELARTNESWKEEAKSFSVKRPKPTERRRRSLAEAKRSELCSPRRSAALRPRPSGRRPGSRCGDGTRCSPVRPSENGRTLMCVTEAAHAACARRAPASLGPPPPRGLGPAGSLFRPRGSAPELCLQSPASRLGAASQPSLSLSFPRRAAAPQEPLRESPQSCSARSVCRHCGSMSPPVCLSGRGSRD